MDPNNWPDPMYRGAPADPTVSGWHWLFVIDRPEPCWWEHNRKCWGGPMLCMNGKLPSEVADDVRYIAPLPLPSEASP